MGQEGYMVWFVSHALVAPRAALLDTLRLTESATVWAVFRDTAARSDWDEFCHETRSKSDVHHSGQYAAPSRAELVGKNLTIGEAADSFREAGRLQCLFSGPPLALRIELAVLRDIPKELHQGFVPASPCVTIGEHDIWECSEKDEGQLFGRATLSFTLMGYGTPANWNEYRRRIWLVPEIIELQGKIETILGPLQRCMYWDV